MATLDPHDPLYTYQLKALSQDARLRDDDGALLDKALHLQFEATDALQEEFDGDVEAFVAGEKASRQGLVKIFGNLR
jgi:uncharacterized protein involved in type VI secretion and phage assembly